MLDLDGNSCISSNDWTGTFDPREAWVSGTDSEHAAAILRQLLYLTIMKGCFSLAWFSFVLSARFPALVSHMHKVAMTGQGYRSGRCLNEALPIGKHCAYPGEQCKPFCSNVWKTSLNGICNKATSSLAYRTPSDGEVL